MTIIPEIPKLVDGDNTRPWMNGWTLENLKMPEVYEGVRQEIWNIIPDIYRYLGEPVVIDSPLNILKIARKGFSANDT